MTVIGRISTPSPQDFLEGYITTLQYNFKFWLVPTKMTGPKAPAYDIMTKGHHGVVSIGTVWKKVSQKPGKPTTEFLTLTFEDPSFPQELNVAAFKTAEGEWDICYRRRQDRQAA